jgi:signal transduction histidine kinase
MKNRVTFCEQHFESLCTLKLKNKEAEKNFTKMREEKLAIFNPYITVLTFILALTDSVLQHLLCKMAKKNNEKFYDPVKYLSMSVTCILFIGLILLIFLKKTVYQKIINYLNYFLMSSPLYLSRSILFFTGNVDYNVYFVILILEFSVRLIYLLLNLLIFHEILILNLLIIASFLLSGILIFGNEINFTFNISYNLFFIFFTLISYFYTKQVKENFNHHFNQNKKDSRFSSILESMNSGFLSLKNGCINYLNNKMLRKFLRNKKIYEIMMCNETHRDNFVINMIPRKDSIQETNLFLLKETLNLSDPEISEEILEILFKNFRHQYHDSFENNNAKDKENQMSRDYNEILSDWKKMNNYDEDKLNFHLLGYKDLEVEFLDENAQIKYPDNTTIEIVNFEIYCRVLNINGEEHIEFIFNDITKTKVIEEKHAEFKVKSLILSKIAHEFKNPLICISELIDQIYDEMENKPEAHRKGKESSVDDLIIKTLPYIKSLSSYLLILVKDLDFFSQSQINKNISLELGDTDLEEVLDFCTQISRGLLKRNNKQDDIQLIVERDCCIPKTIYTDDIKLKQILINLQSNAIKFTNFGSIKLSVSKMEKEDLLKFEVRDTGPGMRDEVKDNLFKPFKKSLEKSNSTGAGLGLSICLDIAKKLGGRLEYTSQQGSGTCFSVMIPYKNISELNTMPNVSEENKFNVPRKLPYLSEKSISNNNSIRKSYRTLDSKDSENTVKVENVFPRIKNIYNSKKNSIASSIDIKKKPHTRHKSSNTVNNYYINKNYYFNSNFNNEQGSNKVIYSFQDSDTENKEDLLKQSRESTNNEVDSLCFIVADDEPLARQSTIRNLRKIATKLNKKITVLESEDGVETLSLLYRSYLNGDKISGIITDENMKLMKGSNCVEVICRLFDINLDVPVYLVTAYEDKSVIKNFNLFDEVFSKPLNLVSAERILNN